ncbi:prepilin-type N-terminal cleavage/methylation domain-containing protein [Vibrio makurazakiensis]|uniref:type II secretion system protein n=1 Tax=Vibrio makurazakiensis TaxID=2910250 RepID=UPI003D13ECD7
MRQRMQRAQNSKKKNKGIALIEMLIVIGVIGLITAGIVGLSTSVFNGIDEADTVSKINTIKGKVQKGYKAQGDYAGLSNASPVLEAEDIENPFGPDIWAAPAQANARDNAAAVVKVPGLTEEACINILTSIDRTAFEYLGTEVGGAAGAAPAAIDPEDEDIAVFGDLAGADVEFVAGGVQGDNTDGTVLTVDSAGAACVAAAATNNAIIVLGFY